MMPISPSDRSRRWAWPSKSTSLPSSTETTSGTTRKIATSSGAGIFIGEVEDGTSGYRSASLAITPQLLQALRTMPPDSQALAMGRLAHELAMQRVIDKALVARNVLQSGLSLPEVTAAGKVSKDMQEKVDRLTQLIEDLMFEHRVRKEMTSNTALTIMEDATQRDSQAARLSRTQRGESTPVEEGRVRP